MAEPQNEVFEMSMLHVFPELTAKYVSQYTGLSGLIGRFITSILIMNGYQEMDTMQPLHWGHDRPHPGNRKELKTRLAESGGFTIVRKALFGSHDKRSEEDCYKGFSHITIKFGNSGGFSFSSRTNLHNAYIESFVMSDSGIAALINMIVRVIAAARTTEFPTQAPKFDEEFFANFEEIHIDDQRIRVVDLKPDENGIVFDFEDPRFTAPKG